MSDKKVRVEISSFTIIKFVLVLLGFYLMFMIRDIIVLFLIVMILVATFSPTVDRWAKKITRPGALFAMILIVVAASTLVIMMIVPPFVEQTVQLFQNAPDYLSRIEWVKQYIPQIKQNFSSIGNQFSDLPKQIISFTSSVFGGLVTLLMVVVLFVYFLMDKQGLKRFLLSFVPHNKQDIALDICRKVAVKAGSWLRGQMLLGVIIAVVNLIALTIIGVPYALTLAVLSGILEIVPTIGPIVSGILAGLVALGVSPLKAIIVVAWFILIQQLENIIIVPKIMQKAVGLSPVIIIFAILIGAKLYGVLGVVLAVPMAASIMVLIEDWGSVKMLINHEE
ncbi:MAG: pheromone autoinducer 2 transporter [bacterium ADurb.Bin212]|nr:MAG: pheromone autoinducer 2 transporter [bacterium ADurb.Bin212]